MQIQHPKVIDQSQQWLNSVYTSATVNRLNIAFNGGKNYKLHRQYNEIISLLTTSKNPTDNNRQAAKVFAYHCVLHAKNGNSFIIPRDYHVLNTLYNETDKRTPSYHQWINVLDNAVDQGLGEIFVGGSDGVSSFLSSIFIMSDKLINIIASKNVEKAPTKPKQSPKESINVWDSNDKKKRQKIKVRGTRDIQNNLKTINDFLATQDIRDLNGRKIDSTLSRSFIKSLDNYGRFSHCYQSAPEEEARTFIVMNGEAVTEGDFSSQHPFICYEQENLHKPNDFKPYHVDPTDCPLKGTPEGKRAIYKMAMMMMFNSGAPHISLFNDMEQKYKTLRSKLAKGETVKKKMLALIEVEQPTLADCAKVIKNLRVTNAEISDHFKGCQAGRLQNLDSQIAEQIMLILVSKKVPFLPYHDSVVVPRSKALVLRDAMFEAWEMILGTADNCRVDYKYGFELVEVEQADQVVDVDDWTIETEHTDIKDDLEAMGFYPSDLF